MPPTGQAIWGLIWKHIVDRSNKSATNATMLPGLWRASNKRTHFKTYSGYKSNKWNQCDFVSTIGQGPWICMEKHEKILKQNCIMMQLRILPSDHDIKNLIIFYLIKEIKIYLVWFGLNRPIIITEVLSKICHWVRKTIINTMNIINWIIIIIIIITGPKYVIVFGRQS